MKKILKSLLYIIIGINISYGQDLHDWQVITNMNQVNAVKAVQNEIWAATSGGAFVHNLSDSSITTFNNLDGISDLYLTCVDNDIHSNIVFGSRSGVISVYNKNSDTWDNDASLSGQEITDVHVIQDTLWVASNKGVGVFLYANNEWQFRDFYTNFPVLAENSSDVIWYKNRIYYGTDRGLLSAPADFISYNLKSVENWTVYSSQNVLPGDNVLLIKEVNDTLVVGLKNGAIRISNFNTFHDAYNWLYGELENIIMVNDTLYFSRFKSIYYYANNRWYFKESFLHDIFDMVTSDGKAFFATPKGLYQWNNKEPIKINCPAGNNIGMILKDRSNRIWLTSGTSSYTTRTGFFLLEDNIWQNYFFENDFWKYVNETTFIYQDNVEAIWIGTWGGGLIIEENSEFSFIHPFDYVGQMIVSNFQFDSTYTVDVLDEQSLNCLSNTRVGGVDDYQVISHFEEDLDGNLWLSTYLADQPKYITMIPRNSNGELDMNCDNWMHFGSNIGLRFDQNESQITCLEFDDFGRLWAGTFDAGLLVIDFNNTIYDPSDDEVFRIGIEDNLYSTSIISVEKDKDGIIWIGTDAGLNSYDGQNFYKHVGEIGPVENKINQITIDEFNNKWFATDGGFSILRTEKSPWEPEGWVHYTMQNSGLPGQIVNTIFVDEESGEAYIGTNSGMAIFSGTFAEYKENLSEVHAGPNPFVLNTGGSGFTIKNLIPGSSVKILTINGNLVKQLDLDNEGVTGSRALWDGTDQNGKKVASGIYLYLIYTTEGKVAKGKISVIRP